MSFGMISGRRRGALLAIAALLGCISCGDDDDTDGLSSTSGKGRKVALVTANACNDGGYGQAGCDGLAAAKASYSVDTTVEQEVENDQAEATMRDLADAGYELIIGYGFQFGAPAQAVAPDYPDVQFVIMYGSVSGANITSINTRLQEVGYLAGIVAGHSTTSKIIGGVGGLDLPPIWAYFNGFCQGAKTIDSSITCHNSFIGTFGELEPGKAAASCLITMKNADVLTHDAGFGGVGVIQAAQAETVRVIGFGNDQKNVVTDNTVLTSSLDGNSEVVQLVVKRFLSEELTDSVESVGIADGIFKLGTYDASVSDSVRMEVETAKTGIANGTIQVTSENTGTSLAACNQG